MWQMMGSNDIFSEFLPDVGQMMGSNDIFSTEFLLDVWQIMGFKYTQYHL